jgi:hypothetical protein
MDKNKEAGKDTIRPSSTYESIDMDIRQQAMMLLGLVFF